MTVNRVNYSTLTGSTVSTNSLALASTLTGSSIILSGNVLNSGTSNLTVGTQSTGLLVLNSQGGALTLQSAGTSIASVSNAAGITMTNGYQLWFNNATGGQSNIRTDGAGSMYFQVNTTASSIFFSTENAGTVYGSFGVNGLTIANISNGLGDLTIGNGSSGWNTLKTRNQEGQPYPTATYGDQSCSFGWNLLGNGEYIFLNNYGNANSLTGGFAFFNRTGASSKTQLMRINSTGVGIGTAAPAAPFQIGANLTTPQYSPSVIVNNINGFELMHIYSNTPSSYNFIRMTSTATVASGNNLFFMSFCNNFTQIGAIVGNGNGTVAFNTISDARYKKNINYEFNALSIINQLKPATFSMIADTNDTLYHGFIAQDIVSIYPQYVSLSSDNIYSMDYAKFVGITVKAIQEQQQIIQQQATHITELQSQATTITTLQSQVATLQSQIEQLLTRLTTAGIA